MEAAQYQVQYLSSVVNVRKRRSEHANRGYLGLLALTMVFLIMVVIFEITNVSILQFFGFHDVTLAQAVVDFVQSFNSHSSHIWR